MANLNTLEQLFEMHDFKLFTNGIYNINLFGVRAGGSTPNKFDDIICMAFYDEAGFYTCAFPITSDPGSSVLCDEMGNTNGTAILPASTLVGSSQYKFQIGSHKSKYPALNQAQEFLLVRDDNRDGKLLSRDEIQAKLNNGDTFKGWFGINIHHASSYGVSKRVDNWSFGCQVFQSIFDWKKASAIVSRSADIFGSKLTYTLFDEVDIIKGLGMTLDEFYISMNDNRGDK